MPLARGLFALLTGALFSLAPLAPLAAKTCSGNDLVTELRRSAPQAFRQLLLEEAKVPYGEGLLYRLDKEGAPSIHVFGTIHVDDPRFKTFPDEMKAALEAADIVATEITEAELKNPVSLLKSAAMAANPKADTLDRLGDKERKAILAALEARGLPSGAAARMDAGFLLLSLALPPCAVVTDPQAFMKQEIVDAKVARLGVSFGAENIGLETVTSQIAVVKGMSEASKFALLTATAAADAKSTDLFVTMKNLYHQRRIARLWVLSTMFLPPDPAVQGAYAEFKDRLIDRRNDGMAEGILKLAADKKVFAAVGALHLIGERGVIRLLEKKGYTATKLW
jgi:uncharacterized protein